MRRRSVQRDDWSEHKAFCKQWMNLLEIERRFQTGASLLSLSFLRNGVWFDSFPSQRYIIDRAALLDHIDRVDRERRVCSFCLSILMRL